MRIIIEKKINIPQIEKDNIIKLLGINNKSEDFICGRTLLYRLIGNKVLNIIYNENGKPYLKDNSIYFNISHSGDYVVCAISKNIIGVDIQKNKKVSKSKLVFTDEELENNNIDLIKIWTKKESIIKALGLNMQHMKELDISNYNVKSKIVDNDYFLSICEIKE